MVKRPRIRNLLLAVVSLMFFASCGNEYIHNPTGIPVSFVTNDSMFPAEWLNEETSPYALSLGKVYRPDALSNLQSALRKYPAEVLKKNVRKIYVLGNLSFFGMEYGGTSSSDVVYIVHYDYDKYYSETTFHHEFASILLRNYSTDFDTNAWNALNPKEFTYSGDGISALADGNSSTYIDYELVEQGFINEYSMSCAEEDICSIVEQLFSPDYDFWQIYEDFPLMRAKVDFIIRFYSEINDTFNEDYFRRIESNRNPYDEYMYEEEAVQEEEYL